LFRISVENTNRTQTNGEKQKTLHHYRADFEPQRASPFMNRVKAFQILGGAARALTTIPLSVIPFALLVVLASSTSGYQNLYEIVTLCRPPPYQDWGRAKRAGNRFARDDKEPGPSWGKLLPGERPRETAET
jgi:hypothetical protein